ncbi:MAG: hypothetical protein DIU70_004570 [Bacillota bacterium]
MLAEALVGALVLGLLAVLLYPGILSLLRNAGAEAGTAQALALLESAGNLLAALPFDPDGQYQLDCGAAGPAGGAGSGAGTGVPCLEVPPEYALALVAVEPVAGVPGLQAVTLEVTGPGGRVERLTVYKLDRR